MTVPSRSVQAPSVLRRVSAPHSGHGSESVSSTIAFFRRDEDIEYLQVPLFQDFALRVDSDPIKGHANNHIQVLSPPVFGVPGTKALRDGGGVDYRFDHQVLIQVVARHLILGLFREQEIAAQN